MTVIDKNALPDGWEVSHLGAIITEIAAGVSVNGEDRPANDGELGVLKLNALSNGRFLPNENKAVVPKDRNRVAVSPRRGDILISRANGSLDLVGASVYIEEDHHALFLPDLLWRLTTDISQNNSQWLHYYLASPSGRRSIESRVAGSNGTHKISKLSFRNIEVVRPPRPEQDRIAAILSIWDRAIVLTEKLIAAKQKRKQVLMNQLLSGKMRFAEFTGKWPLIKMGDIFKRRSEAGTPGIPTLSVTMGRGLIRRDTIDRKMETTLEAEQHLLVRKGDLAYNMMRMWQGASGLALEDGLISPAYIVLKPTAKVDSLFASYFFKLCHTVKLFEDYSFGITGDRLRLYYKDFAAIPTRFPPVPEQRKIAAVLSMVDREIEIHQSKLKRFQSQKKGLMQQLLMGKVRVKVSDESPGE